MRFAASAAAVRDVGGIQAAIERFLKASHQPALLEPGEELLDLTTGNYVLEHRNGRLTFQAWNEARNLVRRVIALGEERHGRLELVIERFARKEGRLWLVDRARPDNQEMERRGTRLVFRERFRRFLARQYPDWKLVEISTEADLEHSLSPAFPRAFLRRGQAGRAAIAAGPEAADATGALSFGLIWLDHLRRRERRVAVEGLTLLAPLGAESLVCQRLRYLDPARAACEAFAYSPDDAAARLDPRDLGNLDTELPVFRRPAPEAQAWVERVAGLEHVETVAMSDRSASLRVRGLEFARTSERELLFGLHQRTPVQEHNFSEVARLVDSLARLRTPGCVRQATLASRSPEAWLESVVRAQLTTIDASLLPSPVYGQVPAWAGGQRGIIDLLACGRDRRLTVLELKASQDLHLPLQALDYWMRVKWHLERGEFTPRGYFPGLELRPESPRLLLVSPALDFHPTTETILQFVSPEVEVERVGLNSQWREKLEVMFRYRGAEGPA